MEAKTAIVLGATGGIGAALVDRLLDHPAYGSVVGFGRNALCSLSTRLLYHCFDPEQVDTKFLNGNFIPRDAAAASTVFVATGGLRGANMFPEKNISQVTSDSLTASFQLNAILPLLLIRACLPQLRDDAKILVLSAKVGSIEDNRYGGWYGYRMAKSALNMGIKTLAIELARRKRYPKLVAVHPGTPHTEMSRRYLHENTYFATARETADRLLALAESNLDDQHGRFVHWDGTALPW